MTLLLAALLFSLPALILFFWLLAIMAPETFLHLRRTLKRNRYNRYIRKYGLRAAQKELGLDPWSVAPWERRSLEVDSEPTEAQFLAYAWLHYLKISLGLLPPFEPNQSRLASFKAAVVGFLLDYGLLTPKS